MEQADSPTDCVPNIEYRLNERHVYQESVTKEARLGVYCSPRFYRKARNWDKSALLSPGNPADTLRYMDDFQSHRRMVGRIPTCDPEDASLDDSPTESTGSSARLELTKRSSQERKKRPLSLAGLDQRGHRDLPVLHPRDAISNLGSSCCNLRTSLGDKNLPLRSPTSRDRSKSNLSPFSDKIPSFQLSRSCSDLRDGSLRCSPINPTIEELRCPSHMSLQSIRVSTPSDSQTGSKISLLSDGVESHEALYDRVFKSKIVDGMPLYPEIGDTTVSSNALVREWLAAQEKYTVG